MELASRLRDSGLFGRISARVRAVSPVLKQQPAAQLLIRHRRRLGGAALLLLSVCAGVWARDLARAESLSAWLAGHPPSERIWRHALESRGYRKVRDEREFRKAARSLPSLADEDGTGWASEDGEWIALYSRREDRLDTDLYRIGAGAPPRAWKPMGTGWTAFDPIMRLADEAAARLRSAPKPRAEPVDPLELRY